MSQAWPLKIPKQPPLGFSEPTYSCLVPNVGPPFQSWVVRMPAFLIPPFLEGGQGSSCSLSPGSVPFLLRRGPGVPGGSGVEIAGTWPGAPSEHPGHGPSSQTHEEGLWPQLCSAIIPQGENTGTDGRCTILVTLMGTLQAKEKLCKIVSAPPPEDAADLCREACLGQSS